MTSTADERLATGRLTIDLAALRQNWHDLARRSPGAATGASVKAQAYGLGMDAVARTLHEEGCRHFFAGTPAEGLSLRGAAGEAEIFVLCGLTMDAAPFYREAELTPVLNSRHEAEIWSQWCRRSGMRRPCAVHVDTGMNRLGMEMAQAVEFADANARDHLVTVVLVMSHLACADDRDHPKNREQLEAFKAVAARFPETRCSLANSAGVLLGRDYHFDITRPGIALYGGEAGAPGDNPMAPVVTLEGRILQVRAAKAAETVGYGATQALKRDSTIAIAGIGYGDGVLRAASGSGVPMRELRPGASGWLGGHAVPVVGRVSMDLTAFDVTDIPRAVLEQAEWVEFFGRHRPLDEFARAAGTIGYEVLTGLGHRVARRYVEG